MNNIDGTKETMEVAEDVLEFLNLKLTFDKEYKRISVITANSFTYLLPSTCCPKKSIENIPKGVALRLRRICDSDEKFDECSVQYQKYLEAGDHKPSKVKKQISDVRNISKEGARRPKNNNNFSASFNLITQYNLLLPNIKTIIKKHLPGYTAATKCLEFFQKTMLMLPIEKIKTKKSSYHHLYFLEP